jgi:hypothetical protein
MWHGAGCMRNGMDFPFIDYVFKGTVSRDFLFYFLLLNTKSVLSVQMLTVYKFLVYHTVQSLC